MKRWVRGWAYAIGGIVDDDAVRAEESDDCEEAEAPGQDIVRKLWNAFIVGWTRENLTRPISPGMARSVTAV